MSVERARRVFAIFESVIERPTDEQVAHARTLCGDDADLLSDVQQMLEAHRDKGDFLEEPAMDVDLDELKAATPGEQDADAPPPPTTTTTTGSFRSPRQIGRYRIIRVLGHGGMGVVYLAEQDNPKRLVALKVIRTELASPRILRRFASEGHALGRLQHPGIAQIFEASTADTPLGPQPFFAMEFIEGEPITAYVARHDADIRARIRLFCDVCDAVHHAHAKGVIHRDLKPANILIDQSGQSKVLDFGIARVTDDATPIETHTRSGELLGTIPYMSPEQVGGATREIDARSDVYALGVILYELLTGQLPYDVQTLPVPLAARVIMEDDPLPMSATTRSLRGDLETITRKALEKEPSRRYDSAADLAADLRRYLRSEPIAARPATTLYQLRKFVRRYRVLVTSVTAVIVILAASLLVTGVLLLRTIRAESDMATLAASEKALRQDAQDAATRSEAIIAILESILLAPDPSRHGADFTVLEMIEAAEPLIAEELKGDPETEGYVRFLIGQMMMGIGQFDEANTQLDLAVTRYETALTPNHPRLLVAMQASVRALRATGDLPQAVERSVRIHRVLRETNGPDNVHTIAAQVSLALGLDALNRPEEAEPHLRDAVRFMRESPGPTDPRTLSTIGSWASVLHTLGRVDEARALYAEAIDGLRAIDDDDGHLEMTLNNLAVMERELGNLPEAERLHREAWTRTKAMLGPTHAYTILAQSNLAEDLAAQARFADALALLEPIMDDVVDAFGPASQQSGRVKMHYGRVLMRVDRYTDALPVLDASLRAFAASVGTDHPSYRSTGRLFMDAFEQIVDTEVQSAWRSRYDEIVVSLADHG